MLFKETDRQLIDKALGGSQRAWMRLVKKHEQRVYNHCLRLCGSAADAMDLMQEVFLAVYRNLPNFHGNSQFVTWLFRITANKTTDWLRSKHRIPTQGASEITADHKVTEHSPYHDIHAKQRNQQITQHLDQLNAEQRIVIELKFFQHFTFDEIASQIGISPNTVKTRLYAGLRKLKSQMEVQNVV
ncbi:MAG: RNA polymerase sigma factor [Gammaproteobacteria bacterium]|nr:RNA polymerase sigma factor [Gammaproteobacteria bacterium]